MNDVECLEGLIGCHAVDFSEVLFHDDLRWAPFINFSMQKILDNNEVNSLVCTFFEHEIIEAIKGMDPFKAPGPNGFSSGFYSHFWEIIKADFMALTKEFEADPDCIKIRNATSLVLVPKKENVEDIRDLRLFSIFNCNYKIIIKFLPTDSVFI